MDYLLLQILLFLILAAVVGFFVGWLSRGHGFESRLLTSENQWRSKHRVLQEESNRLRSELNAIKQEESEISPNTENTDIVLSLPLQSDQDPQQLPLMDLIQDHPSEALKNESDHLEKNAPEKTVEIIETTKTSPPKNLDHATKKQADNLQVIRGIGPKIEKKINQLGIYHYDQVANLTESNINWLSEQLQFKGKIEREDWVSQAKELLNKKPAQK